MKVFDRKAMGERLLALRQDKGIGQNKLAADLQVGNSSISYWETGKKEPSAGMIFKLAAYFNVSSDYIIGLSDY